MSKKEQFSAEEIAVFCSQTAMILNGGIPLYEGIHILATQLDPGRTKDTITAIDEDVHNGSTFYDALKKSGAFPVYMCEMVKVGEFTGKIEDIMRSLAAFYERESRVRAGIRSVIGYPTILFAIMAVIILILVFKIIPMFEDIFLELETDSTKVSMNGGILAGRIISTIVLVLLALVIFMLVFYRTKPGNAMMTKLVYNSRFSGKLADKISTGKFIAALAVMVSGGMDSNEAVENASRVLENGRTKDKADKCLKMINKDEKLSDALVDSGILDPLSGKMLGVAALSGSTDEVLYKISDRYDTEITDELSGLSQIIETVLVVVLAVFVGAILISVMAPLMSVIASIS